MAIRIPFFGKKQPKLPIEPYGGGVRPAVMGPMAIRRSLNRLVLIRTTMTAGAVMLLLVNIFYVWHLTNSMDVKLYVADGTPFSCPLEAIGQ